MQFLNNHLNILCILVLFSLFLSATGARFNNVIFNEEGAISKTIIVDASGNGDFKTVQQAIDSIPLENDAWIHIHVKTGTYTEKINIPPQKPFIALTGESMETTVIQWNDFGNGSFSASATFDSDNFVAANISFKNTYNLGDGEHDVDVAPAVTVHSDKASFYNVGFYGVQDTLSDAEKRHYFYSCYIQGAVDFIWGDGQSIYEECIINVTGNGFITAQGRESDNDQGGFVFLKGSIEGNGPTLLGRAYRSHSRVVFKETNIDIDIKPEGWDIWSQTGHESTITYAEAGCTGKGSNTAQRVTWEKQLPAEELDYLTDIDTFINQDKWIQQQPKMV